MSIEHTTPAVSCIMCKGKLYSEVKQPVNGVCLSLQSSVKFKKNAVTKTTRNYGFMECTLEMLELSYTNKSMS